jgi:hypothetical protein
MIISFWLFSCTEEEEKKEENSIRQVANRETDMFFFSSEIKKKKKHERRTQAPHPPRWKPFGNVSTFTFQQKKNKILRVVVENNDSRRTTRTRSLKCRLNYAPTETGGIFFFQ